MRPIIALAAALLAGGGLIRQGPLAFRYWPGGEPLARHVASLARGFTRLPGLPADVLEHGPAIEVDLAPDPARWDSLTGGGVPDWGAGVAVPGQGRIVLPAFSSRAQAYQFGEVLRHELAHIALHRFLAPAAIPRWFDEGYATWASGGLDWQSAWLLRMAFLLHRAPSFGSLELDWPAAEGDARLAYILSASAVSLLAERAGPRGLDVLLAAWRRTGSLDAAVRDAFGITLGQFEVEWRREVGRRYGWALLLSDTLVFWLLVSPILLLLLLVRRRRDRARLALLRAAEPPDTPAWWLDQPEDAPSTPEDAPPPPP
jgi:hypothetical protein